MVQRLASAVHGVSVLDREGEHASPLGARPLAVIDEPGFRDTFRVLFNQDVVGAAVAWPRLLAPEQATAWLHASDVMVEFGGAPAREALELALLLQAESAARLVDCLLGGRGTSSVASAAGQPTEAECGVLAYAAARLCAGHGGWLVRDVGGRVRERALGHPAGEEPLYWPLSIRTSLGAVEAALLLSRAFVDRDDARYALEISVHDAVEPGLSTLRTGDVLVSDSWNLTDTTEGLVGEVSLDAIGSSHRMTGQLLGGTVRALRPAAPPAHDRIELVLGRFAVGLRALAALASGAPLSLPALGGGPVSVQRGGARLASGELIARGGALGVRITEPAAR